MTGGPVPPRVAIALCADLEGDEGLDLAGLAAELLRLDPGVAVEIVSDLCRRPALVAEVVARTGAARLALGLCARPGAAHDFQAQARRAGLDPFAVELVPVGGAGPAAARVLVARAARLRAFTGSRPDQLKLHLLSLHDERSRRSLLTLPPSTYRPVASVDGDLCLGVERCGLCLPACPPQAMAPSGGAVGIDRDACVACGICITVCPTGAAGLPAASLPHWEAELEVLLAADSPRLHLSCRAAEAAPRPAGWLSMSVPCLGMVTPGWLLQALAAGAASVALSSCGERCRSGAPAQVAGRVEYCRAVLALLGEVSPEARVVLDELPEEVPPSGAGGGSLTTLVLREPAATVGAVVELARASGAGSPPLLEHAASPLGAVTVREETCTACGACAAACPTGALALDEGAEEAALTFDGTLCIACGACVPACPEQAHDTLRMRAATDLAALAAGRVVVKRSAVGRCRRCGRPVAPEAMLERIRTVLGQEGEGRLLAELTQLCSDCRLLAQGAAAAEEAPPE